MAKNLFDGKVAEVRAIPSLAKPRVLAVPFLLWHSSTEVVSENGIYNDQIAICDTNGDGMITEGEARIYAARISEPTDLRIMQDEQADAQLTRHQPAAPTDSWPPHVGGPRELPGDSPTARRSGNDFPDEPWRR